MNKVTKAMIRDAFNELEKVGYKVIHFSSNRALPKSMAGFPDIFIIKDIIVFCEIKLYKDKLSKEQKEMKELIQGCYISGVCYSIVTEYNYLEIRDVILNHLKQK